MCAAAAAVGIHSTVIHGPFPPLSRQMSFEGWMHGAECRGKSVLIEDECVPIAVNHTRPAPTAVGVTFAIEV